MDVQILRRFSLPITKLEDMPCSINSGFIAYSTRMKKGIYTKDLDTEEDQVLIFLLLFV